MQSTRFALAPLTLLALTLWAPLTHTQPAPTPQLDRASFAGIDRVVTEAIAAGRTPGAVVLVGRGNEIVFEQAYGQRALVPSSEAMTLDTVFDLASLTKVVATTTAVMQLVEQGRVRLNDSLATFISGCDRYGKAGITVRHLLTHTSGLRPDVDLHPWQGYDTAIDLACAEVPMAAPGERFVYSDIGFFLLGHIVRVVSGVGLDSYTQREIFAPLGMRDTMFTPPATLRARIAPSERCLTASSTPCNTPNASPLRGVVHDPTARRMGGVAGHAGLFGTARDLSRFARLLLGGGTLDGARVLSSLSVTRMTTPATPPAMSAVRGFGWDIDSAFSSNRGDLFPIGSFGHTGFTGTSLWIDPASQSYVIFLSSRLHPDGRGDVTPLRARVATVAAAVLSGSAPFASASAREPTPGELRRGLAVAASPTPPRTERAAGTPGSGRLGGPVAPTFAAAAAPAGKPVAHGVLSGLDVLVRDGFASLRGKRIGLLTNHTGISRTGVSTIDVLHRAPDVTLAALFSPEHGIRGTLDVAVESGRDERTGLVIHSLYGDTRRPSDAMLANIDTIVIDLQDIGVRFYTYVATMGLMLEEAAKRNISVIVLDRPNPLNGWQIEGPAADDEFVGFNAYLAQMPVRHGMTIGELARLFNVEKKINAALTVVAMEQWRRDAWFDETGLPWVNPSPNMRNMHQATLYPGIGAIEYANISVGRGTDQPFEQVGAPWIDGPALARALNERALPGVRFYPIAFTPTSSKYANERCQGVFLVITNRNVLAPVRVGLEVAAALWRLHSDAFRSENTDRLFGWREGLARVRSGEDLALVAAAWSAAEARWRLLRAPYLLYK